jgi:broad specificity phosphatase PhoE
MTVFCRTASAFAAVFAQLHPLLPGKSTNDLSKFKNVMESANIARIAFLRHGKTGSSTTGKDFDRLLTPEGQEQAREAGRVFGGELMPIFSPVLASSASRTVETANLFFESCGAKDLVELKIAQDLYDGTMQPKGSALFRKISYAPLREYIENEDERDRADAQSVLGAYAHSAVDIIMDTAMQSRPSERPGTLCVVAHAIYLPAAALGVAKCW